MRPNIVTSCLIIAAFVAAGVRPLPMTFVGPCLSIASVVGTAVRPLPATFVGPPVFRPVAKAALSARPTDQQREAPRAEPDAQPYLDLVALYRRDPTAAVEDMLLWPDERVKRGVTAFERRVTQGGQIPDISSAFAAVMLHTEVGLTAARRDRDAGSHLLTAATMLDRLHRLVPDTGLHLYSRGTWHLMVARVLNGVWGWKVEEFLLKSLGKGSVPEIVEQIMLVLQREEPDIGAPFMLALGSLEDGTVQMDIKEQQLVELPTRYQGPRDDVVNTRRREAEHFYRRALELDAHLIEARLRLGRLLFETRRPAAAQAELRQVLSDAREARQVYLACLLLGRIEEEAGGVDRAVEFYTRALTAWPHSQAARIALANAYERSGDVAAAQKLIVWFFAGGQIDPLPDPWSEDLTGQVTDGLRTLEAMRKAVITSSSHRQHDLAVRAR